MIRAIETRYKGYRFRSRLEARWAVFFDALGFRWEYEAEGFALPSGPYLPDFWLPDLRTFAEVKATNEEFGWKQKELARVAGRSVLCLAGTPELAWYPIVESIDFVPEGYPDIDWVDLGMTYHRGRLWYGWMGQEPAAEDLFCTNEFEHAVNVARGARFEHGESPR